MADIPTPKAPVLSTPVALIVAALIVALGIYMSRPNYTLAVQGYRIIKMDVQTGATDECFVRGPDTDMRLVCS